MLHQLVIGILIQHRHMKMKVALATGSEQAV